MQLVLPPGWHDRHPEFDEPSDFEAGSPEPLKNEESQPSSPPKPTDSNN